MPEWPIVEFQALAAKEKSAFSKPYGSAIMKEDYRPQGVPVVRGVNLARGIFLDDEFVFISDEKADEMPGANLRPGDLVITHRGTIGQVSMIPRNPRHGRYVLSTSQVKARLDPSQALPEFYYYWFLSPSGQHELLSNASTVGVPGIGQPVATIKSLKVPHPPLPIQRAIAAVLGALDGKIAVNERIVECSYKLVQALWVEAASGARRFVPVAQVADVEKGLSYKGSGLGGATPLINLGNFSAYGRFKGSALKYYDGESKDRHWVNRGDLLMANTDLTQRREILGQPVLALIGAERALFTHHVFAIRPRADMQDDLLWLYGSFRDPIFRERAITYATGTTVVALPRDAVLTYEVPWPEVAIRRDWNKMARALVDSAAARSGESQMLSQLRDALLPGLISGAIRVRDAEKVVEAAT